MSYSIFVFCSSDCSVAPNELAEFIREGVYFDPHPRFETEPDRLVVHYDRERRPFSIERTTVDRADLELALDLLPAGDPLIDRLEQARCAYRIRVERETITDEAWFAVDSIEAHLARECNGLIFAPGDAIFDENLKPVTPRRTTIDLGAG